MKTLMAAALVFVCLFLPGCVGLVAGNWVGTKIHTHFNEEQFAEEQAHPMTGKVMYTPGYDPKLNDPNYVE